jgi:PAB-dependent poly(A)-specific ribonuclease subunit 2
MVSILVNIYITLTNRNVAARHGVLEEDSSSSGSLTMMMQGLNRFLLDQTIYDLKNAWQNTEESELPQVLPLYPIFCIR